MIDSFHENKIIRKNTKENKEKIKYRKFGGTRSIRMMLNQFHSTHMMLRLPGRRPARSCNWGI